MPRLTYLDTSVVSYLTSRPSRDVVTLAHQQLTTEWWTSHRHGFTLYVSELVLFEAARGNPAAAQARLSFVADLPVIKIDDAARSLAQHILKATALPEKAAADALHLALSAINGLDFLVTWNCTHLANAVVLRSVNAVCRNHGYEPPIVCTPEELMTP